MIDKQLWAAWARERLAASNKSQADLAEQTNLQPVKISRALSGHTLTDATRYAIESALQTSYEEHAEARASKDLGGFGRTDVIPLCGTFLSYRRGFEVKDRIIRSVLVVKWTDTDKPPRVVCEEYNSQSETKNGRLRPYSVSILHWSQTTRLATFLSIHLGAVRFMQFITPKDNNWPKPFVLFGAIASSTNPDQSYYHPATSPMAIVKEDKTMTTKEIRHSISTLTSLDDGYHKAQDYLKTADARCYSCWDLANRR